MRLTEKRYGGTQQSTRTSSGTVQRARRGSRTAARYGAVQRIRKSAAKPVQFYGGTGNTGSTSATSDVNQIAESGLGGSGSALPGLDQIQSSFGKHDVSGVTAHSGPATEQAAGALGAKAFASGNKVAFASGGADLHTAAHEAAHVVQQRHGAVPADGVGAAGDRYEQHADAVADRVVSGANAEPLLDQVGGGSAPSQGVQLDVGDEPLVDFIQKRAMVADAGYTLLCDQVDKAKNHVMMLDAYSSGVSSENNPQLDAAKAHIAETANAVNGGLAALPGDCADAHATAVALGNTVNVATPHRLLVQWSDDALQAASVVAISQAKVAGALVRIKEDAVRMAHLAMAEHEQNMMRGLLTVADNADVDAATGDAEVRRLNAKLKGNDKTKSSAKEKVGLGTTVTDSLNNATTGIAFGAVGALDAGNVFSLSSGAASAMGIVGGVLGILFGAIGTFLGIKNAIRGAMKKGDLKKAKNNLSTDSELEETVDYAIGQKNKKIGRNVASGVGGLVAITAGVIGIVALSVATFGIAAIVAGVAAGLIGLGFVGFRMIRSWQKRKAERTEFADQLIAEIQTHGEGEDQARELISGLGLDPNQAGDKKFRKRLISGVGDYAKSKRTTMAEGIVQKLIVGKPSEVFDSEVVLGALGVDPAWVRRQVEADKPNKAVSKVAGKMASW